MNIKKIYLTLLTDIVIVRFSFTRPLSMISELQLTYPITLSLLLSSFMHYINSYTASFITPPFSQPKFAHINIPCTLVPLIFSYKHRSHFTWIFIKIYVNHYDYHYQRIRYRNKESEKGIQSLIVTRVLWKKAMCKGDHPLRNTMERETGRKKR